MSRLADASTENERSRLGVGAQRPQRRCGINAVDPGLRPVKQVIEEGPESVGRTILLWIGDHHIAGSLAVGEAPS
jgi:hypothetical protein